MTCMCTHCYGKPVDCLYKPIVMKSVTSVVFADPSSKNNFLLANTRSCRYTVAAARDNNTSVVHTWMLAVATVRKFGCTPSGKRVPRHFNCLPRHKR